MNREDIIKLARSDDWAADVSLKWDDFFVRFASLVAAAEREKVAAWMTQRGYATGHGDTTEDLLKELDWQIDERIAAEREALTQNPTEEMIRAVSEQFYSDHAMGIGFNPQTLCRAMLQAIRARGQA